MAYSTVVTRHKTREVGVGDHVVGGENPIWVQSMTTTNTFDVEETVAQILRLEEAGCELDPGDGAEEGGCRGVQARSGRGSSCR